MARGAAAATAADSELLAASNDRDRIDLQIISGNETFVSFGEGVAVKDEGLSLVISTAQARLTVTGARARKAVHLICETGESSVIGYDTI